MFVYVCFVREIYEKLEKFYTISMERKTKLLLIK